MISGALYECVDIVDAAICIRNIHMRACVCVVSLKIFSDLHSSLIPYGMSIRLSHRFIFFHILGCIFEIIIHFWRRMTGWLAGWLDIAWMHHHLCVFACTMWCVVYLIAESLVIFVRASMRACLHSLKWVYWIEWLFLALINVPVFRARTHTYKHTG